MNLYQDAAAEKSLLGAALADPRITRTVKLTEGDFASKLHGLLWEAIGKVHADGLSPDLSTLGPHMAGTAWPALLVEVVGSGVPANADAYAASIREQRERQRIADALDGIRSALELGTPASDVLALAESRLLTTTSLDAAVETLFTLDDFLDRDLPPETWVIPDMLATGDRLVLTGQEGFGKSILMRQIGVAVAAGLNPFTLRRIPPRRVLLVDCENPERIMMSKLGDLRTVLRNRQASAGDRFLLKRYPQGLNLADAKERLDLHHLLTVVRHDLLLIGPAYKLYLGGSQTREEDLARQVTGHLDGLREEFGFALVLEHHSPHGTAEGRAVRPIGSSLWLRWPEFGLGLIPQKDTKIDARQGDLVPWRGSRDQREWPKQLIAGGDGALPWVDPTSIAHRRTA